jgi:hypothetical protein
MSLKLAPVLAAGLLLFPWGEGAAAPPKWEIVYGLARVNGQTRKVEGKKYHLVALYCDPRVLLLGTNTTDVVWLVNGKPSRDWSVPLAEGDTLPGKEDLRFRLAWMALPDRGELEILLGPVHFDRPDIPPAVMRKQMLDGGFVPYTVGVEKVPSLQASTVEELAEGLEKHFGKH